MTRRDLEARYADKSTTPLPPPDVLRQHMRTCDCGAAYLDIESGRDAHTIVMGHRPRAPDRQEDHQDADRDDERE